MADKLRVGIIGCGEIASNHVLGYLNSEQYEVVGLADLSEQQMNDFDERFSEFDDYKVAHFTDFREMLQKSNPEVVSVCVWDKGHAPMTIAAAATPGVKAVLCEKPFTDTLGAAADMMLVCRRNGVKLAVGHQRRFLPSYNMAKQMISDREIGEVKLMATSARDGLPNYSSHLMDIFRYLLSDAECTWAVGAIERETDQYARSIPIEDKAGGILGFDNGAQALIRSGLTDDAGWAVQVYGTDGMIDVGLDDVKVMNARTGGWQLHQPDGGFLKYGAKHFETVEAGWGQALELARWVTGEIDDYRGVGENGYKALEMAHAVYESARTHAQVQLPLKIMAHPLEVMLEDGHLPVRYPGKYDIRTRTLRGENTTSDTDNV